MEVSEEKTHRIIPEEVVSDHELVEVSGIERPRVIAPERRKVRHLPVVAQHYRIRIATATTATIRAPRSGYKLRVTYVHMSAAGAAYVYLQFKNHTDAQFRITPTFLAANTALNANLVGTNIEGDVDEALEAVSDAAVNVDVMAVIEEVPAEVVGEEEEP